MARRADHREAASLDVRWRMPGRRALVGLAGWLALCFAAAAIGAVGSADAGPFYAALSRPAWAPPGWLFAPMWTFLYASMGVGAWLVWKENGWREARGALILFTVQLALNTLWSWLFFHWRLGAAAFAGVVVLWILIACTVLAFWRVRPLAGILLVPYLAWVGLAAALTLAVWQRNPQLLGLADLP
ncbi:MAG TPA: TspO/MBR family protein [Caldimonas sp.]|jgi:tryptophan-rich sensory protein|nr:TspO/MBR family protein [Caldimonas sp.]HEX2539837.1 TspO/MBR family protein [Caldimonas sp.]